MVGVNAGIVSTEVAPFGGVKQSGVAVKVRNTGWMNISRLSIDGGTGQLSHHICSIFAETCLKRPNTYKKVTNMVLLLHQRSKEIKTQEYRVGLLPSSVKEFVTQNSEIAGRDRRGCADPGFTIDIYKEAGAKITASAKDLKKPK